MLPPGYGGDGTAFLTWARHLVTEITRVKAGPSREDRKREAITSAAILCIQKNGAAAVSVDDIAVRAGVGRRTFYRFFSGRRAIMEAVLLMRARNSAERLKKVVGDCVTFEDAIVRGTIEALRHVREDKVYLSVLESERILLLELETKVHAKSLEQINLSIWGDVFDVARMKGQLREDVSNSDAADWLASIQDMLRQRDKALPDPKDLKKIRLMRKFLLPSLMRDSARKPHS
jgi:AcrR family transcriptional regulator